MNIKDLKTRADFAPLLCWMGLTGWAAEIGVAEGGFSHDLLNRWPGRCWQIEPWRIFTDVEGFSGHGEATQTGMDMRYRRILDAVPAYKGRAIPMRSTSEAAAPLFNDGVFDFVYVDACHDVAHARQDIALWFPKVKRGGILAGHDWLDGFFHGQLYGVRTAVTEFAAAHGLEVFTTKETDWPSWAILKP